MVLGENKKLKIVYLCRRNKSSIKICDAIGNKKLDDFQMTVLKRIKTKKVQSGFQLQNKQ